MAVPTAKSNCWTCKERKVGCDRALPTCSNCAKARRECKGYGLKLAWPDKHDGRRKQKRYEADPDSTATDYVTKLGQFSFLNTDLGDLVNKRYTMQELVGSPISDPAASSSIPEGLGLWGLHLDERIEMLLTHYESVLARMITTIDDDTNGFRLELLPMALATEDAPSRSLLQAILALTAFHLGNRDEALNYKVMSIETLNESFRDQPQGDERFRITQFAACMMLCVYSVFDASDTSWNIHLQGARNILSSHQQIYQHVLPDIQFRCSAFLEAWYEYHHTFSEFTHPAQFFSTAPSIHEIPLPKGEAGYRRITGVSGCSTELLRLISCINQLRTLLVDHASLSDSDFTAFAAHIRTRILNIRQDIHIDVQNSPGPISHNRIYLTAELYRIAAVLYIYNTYPMIAPTFPSLTSSPPNSPQRIPSVSDLVRQALTLQAELGVCTSPWPLFMVACNVAEDRDRIEVMRLFREGAEERKIGNYHIITGLIKAIWKRADLCVDEGRDGMARYRDWRDLIDQKMGMPSFA